MDKSDMVKNNNRRRFLRVRDQVNLFYKKIEGIQAANFDSVLHTLAFSRLGHHSDSDFKGNKSRNVNISASGIAFTCEDELKEGDYLVIKLLLGSRLKDLMTCAKVVYCKASKESDSQYPYFIGAHFFNLKNEDQELLIEHVDKKRLQQNWINGFLLATLLIVIAAPGAIFGLLLEFVHFLMELVLEFAHLGFEFIESNLDHLIEHLFETDLHQTQIIVFYMIFLVFAYGIFRLWRIFPPYYIRLKKNLIAYGSRQQASLGYFWHEQSLLNKIKLIGIAVTAIIAYVFLGM